MTELVNEQINANALIEKMVKKSRAAQLSLGKSDFTKRCAALQAAATAIRADDQRVRGHARVSSCHAPAGRVVGANFDLVDVEAVPGDRVDAVFKIDKAAEVPGDVAYDGGIPADKQNADYKSWVASPDSCKSKAHQSISRSKTVEQRMGTLGGSQGQVQ